MQSIGKTDADRDADRSTAALLAGIQGGVVILLSTGSPDHLEAALDQGIADLRRRAGTESERP
ncbi:hypothetical protein ABZ565_25415 [Streptomyces sp. NPDC016469]|uniref:hypothetical protein n=1 Tax=Streptomyces sp. NPDC016469 TaxID=3157191 RepID=UPI0033F1903D